MDGCVLITGEVDRTTEFERGMSPIHQPSTGSDRQQDALVLDNQALVVHVAGRGQVTPSALIRSPPMTLLLVHGGGFSSSCWDRTVTHLRSPAVAVDLPGRGSRPDDLAKVTIDDFAAAVVSEIESRDLHDVVLVGHSLAGLTLPRVVGRVPERLAGVVFVSCCVPPHGRSTLEHLGHQEVRELAEHAPISEPGPPAVLDADLATAIFCNDMDAETTAYTLSIMGPESAGVVREAMDLSGMSAPVPRTWARLTRDVIVTPDQQDASIAALGETDVVDLDSGHMAMISRPRELAAILDRLHGAYATRP